MNAEIDKLQALEMWIWRRLENISWEQKIRNEEVLRRVKENRCLITTIYRRQKNWIGHILRGDGLLRDVMEGRMMGKRPRGRPRAGMMDELMEGSYVKMKRELREERNGEDGCLEPALGQNTYEDDNSYQYLNYNTVRYAGYM